MQRSDFNYNLPDHLIAQFPPAKRGDNRLLHLDACSDLLIDRHFSDLPSLLEAGDLLVFNNTRVMSARLYGHKETGGKVELLIERLLDGNTGLAHVKASKSPRPGSWIVLDQGVQLDVVSRQGDLFELHCPAISLLDLMSSQGHVPLPPYISREDGGLDEERYQTVYAERPGAVAAPTAGLHFDQPMLDRLAQMGVKSAQVTLHVGAGTFQPVRVDNLDEHVMHSEYAEVDESVCRLVEETKAAGHRVIAVGTTSVRSLESASATGAIQPFTGDTRLFIKPGYRFNCVDAMLTNFHLPESTLLMLVSAFSGYERIMEAYRHAVREHYRFFSYGDAMFLTRESVS